MSLCVNLYYCCAEQRVLVRPRNLLEGRKEGQKRWMHCMNICLYDCYSMPKEIEIDRDSQCDRIIVFVVVYLFRATNRPGTINAEMSVL